MAELHLGSLITCFTLKEMIANLGAESRRALSPSSKPRTAIGEETYAAAGLLTILKPR